MEAVLGDRATYYPVDKSPFAKTEKELNNRLLDLTCKRQNEIEELAYRKLRSTDGSPPAIRGDIKHQKSGLPFRPIVSSIGSALYNTFKFLSDILSPIQNLKDIPFLIPHSSPKKWLTWKSQTTRLWLHLSVVSLFTAIPVNKPFEYRLEQKQ